MNSPSNASRFPVPVMIAACDASVGHAARLCARPHCNNVVAEPWEETGTLCASCAIESDLSDREGRWDRCFPMIH